MRTRAEHLAWCKERAYEHLDRGDVEGAFGSFLSDMGKHDETRGHGAIPLSAALCFGGHLSTVGAMREHIDGYP